MRGTIDPNRLYQFSLLWAISARILFGRPYVRFIGVKVFVLLLKVLHMVVVSYFIAECMSFRLRWSKLMISATLGLLRIKSYMLQVSRGEKISDDFAWTLSRIGLWYKDNSSVRFSEWNCKVLVFNIAISSIPSQLFTLSVVVLGGKVAFEDVSCCVSSAAISNGMLCHWGYLPLLYYKVSPGIIWHNLCWGWLIVFRKQLLFAFFRFPTKPKFLGFRLT